MCKSLSLPVMYSSTTPAFYKRACIAASTRPSNTPEPLKPRTNDHLDEPLMSGFGSTVYYEDSKGCFQGSDEDPEVLFTHFLAQDYGASQIGATM